MVGLGICENEEDSIKIVCLPGYQSVNINVNEVK